MTRCAGCAPALCLAFAWAGAWAQATQAPAVDYTISGVVVNERIGQKLSRVTMYLSQIGTRGSDADTTTDEEGNFRFDHLAAGRFALVAQRSGYITQAFEQHDGGVSTAIVTGEGKPSTGLRFALRQQASVFGAVTEDSGDPVPRARILLFSRLQVDGEERLTMVRQTLANEAGDYEIPRLVPGGYYLCAIGTPWYAQRMSANQEIAEGRRSPLDAAYATTCYPGVTDPAEAELVDLRAGERVELPLTLHPEPSVRVVVRQAVDPQRQGYNIPVFSTQIFGSVQFAEPSGITIRPGTDAEHPENVLTADVAPGQYRLTLQGQNGLPTRMMALDASTDTVAVDTAAATQVSSVSGKATMANGGPIPQGLTVSLYPETGDRHAAGVQPSGEFRIESVPPGEYRVRVEFSAGRLGVAQLTATGATVHEGKLKVGIDPVTLNLSVTEGTGTVTGVVQRGDTPARGVFVLLVPKDRQAMALANQSDSDGSFEFRRVPPGVYTAVAIEDGWTLNWGSRDVIEHYLGDGERIRVPKEARELNLPAPVQTQAK